jgi:hypothetical protein
VDAIASLAEHFLTGSPIRRSGHHQQRAWVDAAGPARFAPAWPGTVGDVVNGASFERDSRWRRGMRVADPLRRRLREPTPVVRSLTLRPITGTAGGSPKSSCLRLRPPRRAALTRKSRTPFDLAVIGDQIAPAPEERLVASRIAAVEPGPAPCSESNRARTRRPAPCITGVTTRSIESGVAQPACASGGASCRRALARDALRDDVLTQLVKEHPALHVDAERRVTSRPGGRRFTASPSLQPRRTGP